MNDLSWLLYLAGVLPNLGGWMTFFCAALCLVLVGLTIGYLVSIDEAYEAERKVIGRLLKWVIPATIFSFVIAVAIPGRDTLYAIAASEMGEEVLQSPVDNKATKALEAWLDRQIEPEEPAQ